MTTKTTETVKTTETTKKIKKASSKKKTAAVIPVAPVNNMARITFDDLAINQFTVLNYLDNQFFSDSTVTLSNDDYLKKSIRNRLLQVVFFTEGVISLNKDADTLNRAMLRSSLNEKDIETILNTSLNISAVQLQVQTPEEIAKGDEAKLNEHLEHERRAMGSVDSLISIIEDNLGDTRVKYAKLSDEELQDALNAGYTIQSLPPEGVTIEKPLVLNFDFIDLKTFSPEEVSGLLNKVIDIDSNSELTYGLKAVHFTSRVQTFFADLEKFLDVAIAHGRASSNASTTFVPESDPWKQLWDAR